jgi:hypothetical protein
MKSEVRTSTASENGDRTLIDKYKAVKPRKACLCVSSGLISKRSMSGTESYREGFVEILTKENSLGLLCAVLDEVVDVFECGVEGRLWDLLVLLGSETGEESVRAE